MDHRSRSVPGAGRWQVLQLGDKATIGTKAREDARTDDAVMANADESPADLQRLVCIESAVVAQSELLVFDQVNEVQARPGMRH
jgi:hypothetical protein